MDVHMAEETVTKPTSASIMEFPRRARTKETAKAGSAPYAGYKQPAFLPTLQQMQQVW
jgi:hypothetical protein